MKKDYCCSVLLPLVLITVGGLLTLAICYLLYFGAYTLVETVFYPNKPTAVPAGIIRFYETKAFAAAAIVAIALSCMFLLYRVNKPWIYYYAAAASVLVAIIYAWPQA